MQDNVDVLEGLFRDGDINLEHTGFLDSVPSPISLNERLANRIEGMLLGVAIGDSLGRGSEAMNPTDRMSHYGVIDTYLPAPHAENRRVGLPSDDTQLTIWTLEQLLEDDGLVPEHLARRFCRDRIFGLGGTVREFLRRFKDRGVPWYEAGVESAGNGALMRISSILLPHLRQPSKALWAVVAIAGMITHNDRASNACCVAFVNLLWRLLRRDDIPPRGWWVDTFCGVAEPLEGDTHYRPRHLHAGPEEEGPVSRVTRTVVHQALDRRLSTLEACDQWYSGAFLIETVPSVLYVLERHGEDPEEAIIRAVNDTRDNDTIASIVGAAVGALHGADALPRRWRQGLLGRTKADDDGAVQRLIEKAIVVFLPQPPPGA